MKIKSFKKLIYDRYIKEEVLSANKSVAHLIRTKRKEEDLTQSEIADGICSVSYLSKIENGKCHPENYYVREIMNRMNIEVSELSVKSCHEELSNFFLALFTMNESRIDEIYDEVKDLEVYAAKLIKLGYLIHKEQDAKDLLEYLNAYKVQLENIELESFMYFIAELEFRNFNFAHCMEFLDILNYTNTSSINLERMINLLRIKCAYYINDYAKSIYYVAKIKEMKLPDFSVTKLFEIKAIEYLILLESNLLVEANIVLEELANYWRIDENLYNYLLGMKEMHDKDYELAIKHFIRVKGAYHKEALLKTIESYYELNDLEHVEVYNQILSEEFSNNFLSKLGKFYSLKMSADIYELKEFIHTKLFQDLKRRKYSYYMKTITDELVKFHRTNSRYKAIDELRMHLYLNK